MLDSFTVFEILQIELGTSSLLISLTLCLVTFAKNQFTAPTLSDFSETHYKLRYHGFLLEAALLVPLVLTGQRLRNIFVLMGYYKLYYEPLRRLSRARLTMKPPILIESGISLKDLFTQKDYGVQEWALRYMLHVLSDLSGTILERSVLDCTDEYFKLLDLTIERAVALDFDGRDKNLTLN